MNEPRWEDLRNHLCSLHRSALEAADPEEAVRRHLGGEEESGGADSLRRRLDAARRVFLIAFGKASLGMARGALASLGRGVDGGVVVYLEGVDPGRDWPPSIQLVDAGHPRPNEGSLEAGARVAEMAGGFRAGDVALVLVSGGGSAMFELLPPGLGLGEVAALTESLQHAGADIAELNTVRRALSLVKGGGLARLLDPAAIIALLLSDVVGDRLETIASGPTVPSPTGPEDALGVLKRHGLLERFPTAARLLSSQPRNAPGIDREPRAVHAIVGSNRSAAAAVGDEAARLGFHPLILTTHLEGEAREAGRVIGGLAWSVRRHSVPVAPPACLVLGGETTVTVRGDGKGGRNQELAAGAAISLDGCQRAAVLSFATDGIDGNSGAAGAFATGETLARARAAGLSVERALEENDTNSFFGELGDLWMTGPTGTNVNDLAIVLVYSA